MRPTSPYHIPERSYEKYMPDCDSECPSTGCFSKVTEHTLRFECVHCHKTSEHVLDNLPVTALKELVNERMVTAEKVFGGKEEKELN